MKKTYNEFFDETYYEETLNNGLKVIIFHKPAYLSTAACFGTPYGSLNINQKYNGIEKHFNPGIAHFLEHKLFEAEGKDILNRFSELGSNVNAFTSYKETVYFFSKTDEDIDASLNLLLDFVQDLDITDESVEKEKGIICEELSMYLQNPNSKLVTESLKSLYQNHPLKYDIGGDFATVNKISKNELYDCYNINYHPSNMYLVITSPVDPNHIIELIRNNQNKKTFKTFYDLKDNNEKEPVEVSRIEHEFSMKIAKGKVSYAIKLKPNYKDRKDAYLHELAINSYLSCYFSPSNPDYQKWIEKGIINDYFGYETNVDLDTASILFYMEGENPNELKDLVENEFKKDLINDELIEQYKRRILGSSFKVFNDIEGFTINYIRDRLNGLDYFEEIEIINSLNAQKIKEIFNSYDLSNYSLIHISPR